MISEPMVIFKVDGFAPPLALNTLEKSFFLIFYDLKS